MIVGVGSSTLNRFVEILQRDNMGALEMNRRAAANGFAMPALFLTAFSTSERTTALIPNGHPVDQFTMVPDPASLGTRSRRLVQGDSGSGTRRASRNPAAVRGHLRRATGAVPDQRSDGSLAAKARDRRSSGRPGTGFHVFTVAGGRDGVAAFPFLSCFSIRRAGKDSVT